MKVKDLREWINELPQEFDENDVIFRRIIKQLNDGTLECLDIPLSGVGIDEEDNEMYLCDEYSSEVIDNE